MRLSAAVVGCVLSMRLLAGLVALLPVLLTHSSPAATPQTPCVLDAIRLPAVTEPIAFTPEQETLLGEIVAEHVNRSLDVVQGPLNDHLQRIGERIVAHLPATGMRFTFRLVDQPVWSAFAMPGGRIFVTRKLVAYSRSEDELAGVIAHEVGHVLARHLAIDLTAAFKKSIGVSEFGDRDDIEAKYRQLLDAKRRDRFDRKREHRQQLEADLVALIAASRAGYSPAAFVEVWDRFTGTEGRTGNFFSDLFGATRPESRRLREMLKTMAVIPAECRGPLARADEFAAWQRRVIEYDGPAPAVSDASAAGRRITLSPPLTPDLTHLRFSPDGRWALAQDTAGISVLSREPFEPRFRIAVDMAEPARFSGDSREVLVHTASQRIARWSVDSGQRVGVVELAGRQRCHQSKLSDDGALLGCVSFNYDVLLIDTATDDVLYRKIRAYTIDYDAVRRALSDRATELTYDVFQLEFSPDGRYFIVGGPSGETVVDITAKAEAKLPSRMKRAFANWFAFLGNDRVVTVEPVKVERSTITSYPDGKLLGHVTLGGKVTAATRGDFVVLRPIQQWAVGLVDLNANRIVLASRTDAFDAFERLHLTERPNGEIGLYELGSREPKAVATLPRGALGPVRVYHVSPDLGLLALSGRDRGGVWNLATGERVAQVRGFTGAFLAPDGAMYADFPGRRELKDGEVVTTPRKLVRLDLTSGASRDIATLDDTAGRMSGRYLTSTARLSKNPVNRDFRFEVRDVVTNAVAWSRDFEQDIPLALYVDGWTNRLVIEWSARSAPARQAMAADAGLEKRGAALDDGDAFVEVLDLGTRMPIGRLFVDTNDDDERVRDITSTGNTVLVSDVNNQLTVYSLRNGDRIGSVFGYTGLVSESAGVLCVRNDRRALDVYDLKSLERMTRIGLPSVARLIRFDSTGTRLMALTTDQAVHVFDITTAARPGTR